MATYAPQRSGWPYQFWLIGVLIAVIFFQHGLIMLAGVKHIPIKAGYHTTPEPPVAANQQISKERVAWLESRLAPSPRLVWSDLPVAPKSLPSNPRPLVFSASYVQRLPDLRDYGLNERKETFINIVIPLILRANQELLVRRKSIIAAHRRGDIASIRQWAELYLIEGLDRDIDALTEDLLTRVDTIPIALALAQAIVESGWGTSRFARQGNALFGQWAWKGLSGIKPLNPSNDRAVVRSFPDLFESTRAYMHNLNTHYAYIHFRRIRATFRDTDPDRLTRVLIPWLDNYAEDGNAYISKLSAIIDGNDLMRFNEARLNLSAP